MDGVYVVTNGDQYWRAGRVCREVEVELFFNPARKMRERIEREDVVAVHAFATGEVLLDRTGEPAELVNLARRLWDTGPTALTGWQVKTWRYRLSDLARDLDDLEPGSAEARLVAGLLVPLALDAYCALHRIWPEKAKRRIGYIAARDPALGDRVRAFYEGGMDPAEAGAIADDVLAPFGGRILTYESDGAPC